MTKVEPADRWKLGKLAIKVLFAAFFIVSGVGHFASTEMFVKIMPSYLPYPRELVLISGAAEIALGVLLLVPRTSRLAAWGLIALLIAVLPANISMYQHRELFPSIPPMALLFRLPMQGVLVYWAFAYTRKPSSRGSRPR